MQKTFTDLSAATFQQEATLTSQVAPLVINAGSIFIDPWGDKHTDACGWLAVHAALQYAAYIEMLPIGLYKKLMSGAYTPTKLKILSDCTTFDTRMSDEHIKRLCAALNIDIVLWEKNAPVHFRETSPFRIDLWLTCYHYYAYIRDAAEQSRVTRFVASAPFGGLSYDTLKPATQIAQDAALARMIADAPPLSDDDILSQTLILSTLEY